MEQHRNSPPQRRRRAQSPPGPGPAGPVGPAASAPPSAPPAPGAVPQGALVDGAAVRPVGTRPARPPVRTGGKPAPSGGGRPAGGAGGGSGGPGGPGGGGPGGKPGSGPRRPGGGPGRRAVPPVVLALRRLPGPRLTGLGAGLFACATMFLLGCLDWLLFDGSPLVYGLLFLPVSALTALWVRAADLVTAPISVPIAFAVGVVPIAGGTGGFGGRTMAVVTALAVHAGWLYGGTLVAGLLTSVRKVRHMGRRQRTAAARVTQR
ncbi:DUF6542 domain-containing protein [Streptomyces sp. WAC05374]|uniref:DUF6542 domain-containing protein n=1 Tax=Streptomyces sp. WAC05374 TaxID=2487420 RepID=UPI003FCEBCAC